jgi:hypothetical protein
LESLFIGNVEEEEDINVENHQELDSFEKAVEIE